MEVRVLSWAPVTKFGIIQSCFAETEFSLVAPVGHDLMLFVPVACTGSVVRDSGTSHEYHWRAFGPSVLKRKFVIAISATPN